MSNPLEQERFMANVLDLSDLIHELITQCWNAGIKKMNPMLMLAAKGYISNYDKVKLIETFINYSNGYWHEISGRNEDFFISHSGKIFGDLPVGENNIDAFKMIFTAKDTEGKFLICQEDRDAIWDMFDSLVKICIKYVHRVRNCVLEEKNGKFRPMYKNNLFPSIRVREQAKKWDIILDIPKA